MPPTVPNHLKGPLLVLAGALCFSTTGTVQTFAPAEATPLTIGLLRMAGGAVLMLLWCAARGNLSSLLPLSAWPPRTTLMAVVSMCCFQTGFFAALPLVGVTVGTVASLGTTPVAVGVLGWLILKERPSRIWYIATTLAVAGICVLAFAKGDPTAAVSPLGLGLAVFAGISYGMFVIMSKILVASRGTEATLCVVFIACSFCLIPVQALSPEGFSLAWAIVPNGLAVVVTLAFISTALAYSLTLSGLRTTPVALASTLALGEPLGASLLGILLLGEPVSALTLAGLALLFLSMGLLVKG